MEIIFNIEDCNKANKVSLATYQLKGSAGNIWRLIKPTLFLILGIEIWAKFKRIFMNKYFIELCKMQKFESLWN